MRRLLALLLLTACAATRPSTQPVAPDGPAAFATLVDGQGAAAARDLDVVLARTPGDPTALFGQALQAWGEGRDGAALEATLRLLAEVDHAPGDPWLALLSTAASAHLPELLLSSTDPRPAEARLRTLPVARLSWPARVMLDETLDGVARRRGDRALLDETAARLGCLTKIELVGAIGRLPHLDLAASGPTSGRPRPLEASGCRLTLPTREGIAGVRVLRAEVDSHQDSDLLVLDFAGPALVRIDGGAFVPTSSPDVYLPRWAAISIGRAGHHRVEIRLGTYGGPAQLRVFVTPPGAETSAAHGPSRAAAEIAELLEADVRGDVDRALALLPIVKARPRFAVGWLAAADVAGRDPTRPAALAHDQAEALSQRAVDLDPRLARGWRELARAELARDRPGEAVDLAERAAQAAPGWWPTSATLAEALRGRGLEQQADVVLDRGLTRLGNRSDSGCDLLQLALQRAQQRDQIKAETTLVDRVAACDAQSTQKVEWLRRRGDLTRAASGLRAQLPFTADALALRTDLAGLRLALGDPAGAARDLGQLVDLSPTDPALRLKLADAWLAAGRGPLARQILADTVRYFPGASSVRQVARVAGLPLPVDGFRLDGAAVIADFQRAGTAYDAPAVLVLDRTVVRVLEDGTQLVLTHNIVNVKSKDGISRWGEVQVPEGAEILALRTRKADGQVREPDEISGKDTISAPDLGPGDFVEWETIDYRDPAVGYAPGFLTDRFYFQSVELPLHRSELLLVTPPGMPVDIDRRAGAPTPEVTAGLDGTRVLTFRAAQMPQLFAEPAAAPYIDWIPSVRIGSRLTLAGWRRLIDDELYGLARSSPALREVAARLLAEVKGDRRALPSAIVRWVGAHIEPESALSEPATASLARGRGSRAAVMLALARSLGIDAQLALARPPTTAPADAPVVAQELDDFGEALVRFPGEEGGPPHYVDPRYKRMPFGFLPPSLDGALCLVVGSGRLERAVTTLTDQRTVDLGLRVAADGSGEGTVTETLRGSPAEEWVGLREAAGADERKLRQEFEQRWLSHHFPGARLGELSIELTDPGSGQARVHYTFSSPRLATRRDRELRLVPSFFRSQPARRFATERRRHTGLFIGAETPLSLEARIDLPAGARVIDAGHVGTAAGGPGGHIRFVENREVGPAGSPRVLLQRQTEVPLSRVPPDQYEALATTLRKVDPIEQSPIRFTVPAEPAAARP